MESGMMRQWVDRVVEPRFEAEQVSRTAAAVALTGEQQIEPPKQQQTVPSHPE